MTTLTNDQAERFWQSFAAKHRPETTHICRILSHKKLTRDQFVQLVKVNTNRMPPSKARQIYDYLEKSMVLDYPGWTADDAD